MLKSTPWAPSYIPNHISLGKETQSDSYECLVSGNLNSGAVSRLFTLLESAGMTILHCSFEVDSRSGTFSALLMVQSQKSDAEMFGLVEKIMRTHLVDSIEFSPREKRIFSHFRFPLELTFGQRGVLITPNSLLLLERSYEKSSEAPAAYFFDGGRSFGSELVSFCPKKSLFDSETEYIEAVLEVTQAAGWGICTRQILEGNENVFTMSEPPSGSDSSFVVGMLVGIAESALKKRVGALTTHFDKPKNVLSVKMVFE